MSHWAEIDENNKVLRVLVGDNNDEDEGYQWLINNFGGTWIKTSYNTVGGVHLLGGIPLRKNYAGIGYIYDKNRDSFYAPQPFPSWVLDENSCVWKAPIPIPTDSKIYKWVEADLNWQVVDLPQQ